MPGPFDYKIGLARFEGNDKYESLYNVSIAKNSQWKPKFHTYNSDAFWLMQWDLNTLWGLHSPWHLMTFP